MSEKIFALLIRLYPADFRQRHGDEALRLVLDRARDEKGLLPRLRLWLDLIWDLVKTVPAYAAPQRISQISPAPDGVLSFHLVGGETPSPSSLLMGFFFSFVLIALLPLGLGSSGSRGRWEFPRLPSAKFAPQQTVPPSPPDRVAAGALDAAARRLVIQEIAASLNDHYFDVTTAKQMGEALRANENGGSYDSIGDRREFAALLTRHLREMSQDLHLEVVYRERPLPNGPPPLPSAQAQERHRAEPLRQNCTFEPVQMLPNKVGYLKLNSFPPITTCSGIVQAAVAELNEAESVVLDLRDNRGGFPDMVMLTAAYFFDHPQYIYNPRESTTENNWTRSPIAGNKLADKPLYILTSSRTISAAEAFCYNFKMLKRATIVGETTRGSAHAGVLHRIGDNFGIAIPAAKPINPYSKVDWEGVGVEPDVKVKAADALTTAVALAGKTAGGRLR